MGAARLQREAAHAAAFLSRLANLHNREILVMRGYKIYKRLIRVTPSRSFVRSQCVVDGLQKIHSERAGVLKISLAGANNLVPTTGLKPCIIIIHVYTCNYSGAGKNIDAR